MFRRLVVMLCLIVAPILCAAEDTEARSPGVYLKDHDARQVCSMVKLRTTNRPDEATESDPVVLEPDENAFDIVLSRAARRAGIRPGALRLLRLNPPEKRGLGKVVPVAYELDPDDQDLFHVMAHNELEAGEYRFCVEQPDFSTGRPEMVVKMVFFGCNFVVSDSEKDPKPALRRKR